ncbi:hypothetical protein NDU88_009840 [Pleurodeles waltl]|uniref:Uncharacterized protein n=1 Tax=Pleurodeles waltl TaxID=8319 RepID=A0AAV7RYS1_PLEWA|nr:hypothetical protein NDU88_009840 [Pleurodeles waltl]
MDRPRYHLRYLYVGLQHWECILLPCQQLSKWRIFFSLSLLALIPHSDAAGCIMASAFRLAHTIGTDHRPFRTYRKLSARLQRMSLQMYHRNRVQVGHLTADAWSRYLAR